MISNKIKRTKRTLWQISAMAAAAMLWAVAAHAQAPTISYPAPAQDLTRGYSQGNLTVKLVFNGVCTGATTAKIALPASVTYVAGSLTKTGGSAAMSITEGSIADLSNPVFNISGIAAIGDNITFTVARSAACGSLATAKDSVYIFTSGGCSNGSELVGSVNTYNILSPSLAITPPPALVNAVIGTTATRTTTITNGGNGVLDTLRFYIVYPGGGIINTSGSNAITANGTSFIPSSTSGDTLFYKIYGATLFGGNNLLSNGETVTITEPVKVVKCNAATAYGAGWGGAKPANQCQVATGNSATTMATGVPNLGITIAYTQSPTSSPCNGDIVTVTYTNNGNGGNAGAAYDVQAILGNTGINTPMQRYGFTADDPKLNGAGAILSYTYAGGNAPNVVSMSQFTADPDGANGLADLDGDGQFDDLAPGKSFSITYTRKIIPSAVCPFQAYAITSSQATYNTMCKDAAPITTTITGSGLSHEWSYYGASTVAPPSVYPGVPFTVRICGNGSFYPPNPAGTDSLETFITLPAGVTFTGTASFNGGAAPDYIAQTGNILTIRQKFLKGGGTNGFCMSFEMVYDCTGPSVLTLPFDMEYVADRSCNAIYKMECANNKIAISTHCSAPCPTGPSNHAAIAQRTTLGWTDNTLTTKVTAASLPALSLKSVTEYDTVNIKQGAVQNGTYSNLYYFFQEGRVNGYDVFNYVNGTFHFKAGSTGPEIVCALPAPDASASTSTLTKLKFNISTLLGGACGLPATVNSADTFWVDMNYGIGSANTAGLYGTTLQPPPSSLAYFYNTDAAGAEQYCDKAFPEVYVIGLTRVGALDYGHSRNISGCTSTDYSLQDYRLYNTEASDVFPNEYRPVQLVDSVVVTLPVGVYLDPSVQTYIGYQSWNGLFGANGPTIPVTPVVSGNKIIFKNPGSWITSDIASLNFFNNARLYYSILPSCSIDPAHTDITVTYYKHDYYYSGLQPQTVSSYTRTNAFTYNATTAPSISVQNNTGVVQGIKTQQYWDVQVNSTGTTTAPYLWLALEKAAASGIIIDSVVLKPSNVVMTPNNYGSANQWFKVSAAGLTSGSSQQARVYFKYNNCTADSILLRSGWNCTGYPSPDPLTGYACTAAQTYLKVIPQPSQVQLSVARQPGGGSSINLCSADSALLIVNSAQAANLVNPYVLFYPPAGVTMASTIQVEYPLGSGNYQNAAITSVAGGGYKIDLTAHTAIGTNGMLGTASANPSFTPLGGDRQAKIKLDFTTGCGFSSGSSFAFSAYGNMPCGAPATGNGITATTAPLNINGVTVSGSAGVNIDFGSTTSASCGTSVPVALTTTPTSAGTSAGDTMVYTLPIGLAYAGGLTAGFTADTSGTGGATVVKVAMPAGVPANTPINYSFNVMPSGGGCGNVPITGAYKRSIAPLSCSGTPCTGSTVVIATGTSPAIALNKPSLNITGMSTGTTAWMIGTSQTVHLTYNNSGSAASVANADTVEFFCGSSTVPFAKRALTKNVAIGGTDADDFTILAPRTMCSQGDLLTAKIQTTTAAGTAQCLCAPGSFQMTGVPLPLTFIEQTATADNCAVNISWSYNAGSSTVRQFSIERSSSGRDYSNITSLPASTTSYTDVAPATGKWLYRIKATEADARVTYSTTMTVNTTKCTGNNISVYPNPASSKMQIVLQGNSSTNTYELRDATGRTLLKGSLRANTSNTLDIQAIAPGIYMLSIWVDGALYTNQVNIVR